MLSRVFSLVFYLLVNNNIFIDCVEIPPNPCPDVFQYIQDQNGDIYGTVTIPYAYGTKFNISVAVAAWMPGYYPDIEKTPIEIELITPFDDFYKDTAITINYNVKFPFKDVVPRISKIAFNDGIICNGIPEPANDGSTQFTICGQTHYLNFPSEDCKTIYEESNDDLKSELSDQIDNNKSNLQILLEDSDSIPSTATKSEKHNSKKSISNDILDFGGFSQESKLIYKEDDEIKPILEEPIDSKQVFKKSISSRHTPFDDICGRPDKTSSLIYLGEEVPRGAFPWLVAIFKQFRTSGIMYICSGSLISDKHVVTAAHCVKTTIKPSEILCVFGKTSNRDGSLTPEEISLKPESIFVHPDYKIGRANADISILKFSDSITFNQVIKPLCLWQGSNNLNDVVGHIGIVASWGTSEKEGPAELKQFRLPIVDQLTCLTDSGPSIGHIFMEITSTNTFCAGNRDGSGPCVGDGGAAFVLIKNNTFFLKGIVSTAIQNVVHRTCDLFQYIVFTDASKYIDWIMDTMSK